MIASTAPRAPRLGEILADMHADLARRNWFALVRCVRRSCGAAVAESLEDQPDWFDGNTRAFHMITFRVRNGRLLPHQELHFVKVDGRWRRRRSA